MQASPYDKGFLLPAVPAFMSLSSHKASGRRTTLVVTALVLLAVGAGLWFWVLKPASHGTAAPSESFDDFHGSSPSATSRSA